MGSFTTCILLLTLTVLLCLASAQHGREENPSVVVTGTVFCDTCFQRSFSRTSRFMSGATVAIECGDGKERSTFKEEIQTDTQGEFTVKLPFPVNHNTERIRRCSVMLVRSSETDCSVISKAVSSTLKLKSTGAGLRIFSAGFLTFKPLHQPEICSQKPILTPPKHGAFGFHGVARPGSLIAAKRSKRSLSGILDPTGFFSPPAIPFLPSPPAFPFPMPPNPFQPPPAILPVPSPPNPFPNPFQPPPFFSLPTPPNPFQPPPFFPPIPFLTPPPPPPFFSFPPIHFPPNPFQPPPFFPSVPFLTPPPPPPPPPPFFSFPPIHFPPNPFQPPSPLIPCIPPAAPAKTATKKATSHA